MTASLTPAFSIPTAFRAEDLDWSDRVIQTLRALYLHHGYKRYRMNRFESYDMYVENRGFLGDSAVISFTGPNGHLMALRPDVTLSIVKDMTATEPVSCQRLFYVENVYRVPAGSEEFREIAQMGVELIGRPEAAALAGDATPAPAPAVDAIAADIEVLRLALESMSVIGPSCRLALSYMGLSEAARAGLAESMRCAESLPEAIAAIQALPQDESTQAALATLEAVADAFAEAGTLDQLFFDLSSAGDTEYYTGLAFQGYVEGLPRAVLSGGRYDGLMERFGHTQGATGFALYLGEVAHAVANQA